MHPKGYDPSPLIRGGFSYLMEMYAENFLRLERLFSPLALEGSLYRSSVGDGLDLWLEVQERHPYTLMLRLTHRVQVSAGVVEEPAAFVRVYRDARLAEVTHCYVGKTLLDVFGPFPSVRTVVAHRKRMNTFLNRWLEYLEGLGHGRSGLRLARVDHSGLATDAASAPG